MTQLRAARAGPGGRPRPLPPPWAGSWALTSLAAAAAHGRACGVSRRARAELGGRASERSGAERAATMARPVPLAPTPAFLPPTYGVLKSLLENPLKLPLHHEDGESRGEPGARAGARREAPALPFCLSSFYPSFFPFFVDVFLFTFFLYFFFSFFLSSLPTWVHGSPFPWGESLRPAVTGAASTFPPRDGLDMLG